MNNTQMQDRDLMMDMLSSEKFATSGYNTYANECATPRLREDFLNILRDEHEMQAELFTEINSRGWYPTTPAEQPKIDQAKQKYQNFSM
jgi:spore coat protein CotF